MRSYLIDEISPGDIKKINDFLKKDALPSSLNDIFWIKIPDHLLTQRQLEHKECAPFLCAVELGKEWIKLEFFVRSSENMKCTCAGYCTPEQMEYVMGYANRMIEELGVKT